MGVWAAGLPSLNDRLDLGPALLGRVLLLISGGALASMLLAGRLVDRWGSRRLCWIAGPLSGVALLGPALAPSPWVLMVLAVVFGMGLGVLEIAMNAHSVEVERCYGRPIISAFHGTWSLGGAAGGGLTSLVLQGGLDAQGLLVVAAIVVPFLYLPAARLLLPDAYTRPGPAGEAAVDAGGGVTGAAAGPGEGSAGSGGLSAPGEVPGESAGSAAGLGEGAGQLAGTTAGLGEGVGGSAGTTAGLGQEAEKPAGSAPGAGDGAGKPAGTGVKPGQGAGKPGRSGGDGGLKWGLIALLGLAAFAGHLSEGAAIDWAALHARMVLEADPALAPLAYTIFSIAMTTFRLLGDPIRGRLGSVLTIRLAGVLATAGYALVLVSPILGDPLRVVCAWTGWALAGVGLATVVPVLFSAVGAAGGRVGRALAMVTAFGYSGLLLGPAVLGFVAEAASLPVALIIPAVLAAVVTAAGSPAIRALLALSSAAPSEPSTPGKEPTPNSAPDLAPDRAAIRD